MKMKKLTAMLLGLLLLFCAVSAGAAEGNAAELPFIEAGPLQGYFTGVSMTAESYPQVCISPYGASSLFESDYREPWYATFSCPEGTVCTEFDAESCHLINTETDTQYMYQLMEDYSYESFLNKCEDESNILLDGSDKIAAYISLKGSKCYLLFGVDEIRKGAKLYTLIYLGGTYRMEDAEKAALLKDAALAEAERLKGNIVCEKKDTFWTDGAYQGVKVASEKIKGMTLAVTMGEAAFHFTDNEITDVIFPTGVGSDSLSFYAVKERGAAVNIKVDVNTYSPVFYNREESEITRTTLNDGNEWGIYVSNIDDNGRPFNAYASRILNQDDPDNPVYLNIQLDPAGGLYWADLDAFVADLNGVLPLVQTEGSTAE